MSTSSITCSSVKTTFLSVVSHVLRSSAGASGESMIMCIFQVIGPWPLLCCSYHTSPGPCANRLVTMSGSLSPLTS